MSTTRGEAKVIQRADAVMARVDKALDAISQEIPNFALNPMAGEFRQRFAEFQAMSLAVMAAISRPDLSLEEGNRQISSLEALALELEGHVQALAAGGKGKR